MEDQGRKRKERSQGRKRKEKNSKKYLSETKY